MSEGEMFVLFLSAYVGVVVWFVVLVEVMERRGRVPVISPAWEAIKALVVWCLRLPGWVVRWLRPGDTPRGLGGA